jgi:FAD/FMN-containing dehydrogenase
MEVTGMDRILKALAEIVGEEHVSDREEELYIYSRDPGLMEPHKPDYVVMPKTTEEVQKIVQLANKEKIPIVPVGGFTKPVRFGYPPSRWHRVRPKKNG